MKDHDYTEFLPDARTATDLLTTISSTAEEVKAKNERLEAITAQAAELEAEIKSIVEDRLPALMEQAGFARFETDTGMVVDIKEDVRTSLSRDRMPMGVSWLREHGYDAIVKTRVISEFSKGEDEDAQNLYERNRQTNRGNHKLDSSVHASTLNKWAREMLAEGQDLSEVQDLFKITRQRVAKIKEAKS